MPRKINEPTLIDLALIALYAHGPEMTIPQIAQACALGGHPVAETSLRTNLDRYVRTAGEQALICKPRSGWYALTDAALQRKDDKGVEQDDGAADQPNENSCSLKSQTAVADGGLDHSIPDGEKVRDDAPIIPLAKPETPTVTTLDEILIALDEGPADVATITARILVRGRWVTSSKTPERVIAESIRTHRNKFAGQSLVIEVDKGRFALRCSGLKPISEPMSAAAWHEEHAREIAELVRIIGAGNNMIQAIAENYVLNGAWKTEKGKQRALQTLIAESIRRGGEDSPFAKTGRKYGLKRSADGRKRRKPGKTATDVLQELLRSSKQPRSLHWLVETIIDKQLWASERGKSTSASLNAALSKAVQTGIIVRVDWGVYALPEYRDVPYGEQIDLFAALDAAKTSSTASASLVSSAADNSLPEVGGTASVSVPDRSQAITDPGEPEGTAAETSAEMEAVEPIDEPEPAQPDTPGERARCVFSSQSLLAGERFDIGLPGDQWIEQAECLCNQTHHRSDELVVASSYLVNGEPVLLAYGQQFDYMPHILFHSSPAIHNTCVGFMLDGVQCRHVPMPGLPVCPHHYEWYWWNCTPRNFASLLERGQFKSAFEGRKAADYQIEALMALLLGENKKAKERFGLKSDIKYETVWGMTNRVMGAGMGIKAMHQEYRNFGDFTSHEISYAFLAGIGGINPESRKPWGINPLFFPMQPIPTVMVLDLTLIPSNFTDVRHRLKAMYESMWSLVGQKYGVPATSEPWAMLANGMPSNPVEAQVLTQQPPAARKPIFKSF